ncbi:MAG TPA: 1-deoxy-D-xylulose-5-phosphate synthase [Bacteroidota bacterium]|jgi:1-deoxy-D-xylulose-5-phosphate synthase|nr:1-deoxy-D-xylulose-5-phosphate synthase [Bacteroidota bacterium]
MSDPQYQYLLNINSPEDLRKLSAGELKVVCAELRTFIVDTISKVGGHLGAGLGTVELAVALHYVFNTPEDKLVWDVGHQAYPHKVLTGRRDNFHTIRQYGGISGFLRRAESEYDTFGAGHASTAISAALGMAAARDFDGKKFKVIAVVGDGSMTGGMAYEAMNNAGVLKKDMIVVLNDNHMVSLSSVQPNIWSLHNYFNEMLTHPTYNKFKASVWDLTGKLDSFGDRLRSVAQKVEKGVKAIATPGMLFEALGFRYFGPFNGHNIVKLLEVFEHVKDLNGPIFIHTITEKGKGYAPAEREATRLHGVTPFDKVTGQSPKNPQASPAYTSIFGRALVDVCRMNPKVIGITAAMPDGTGLTTLHQEMPERFFDVGIAEQHAVTFAAGMATQGYVPVVAIYSTFLQRAYDQIVHDVALQNLNVVFVMDRGGIVGADGPTHHGVLDLAYLRCIPNMVVMAPKDESELRDMLHTAVDYQSGPIAMRYPRGTAIGGGVSSAVQKVEIGKGEIVRPGRDVAILAIGNMVYPSLKAAEFLAKDGIETEVVNMRFVKPIDSTLIESICSRFQYVLTVEDHVIHGGFGSAVLEVMAMKRQPSLRVKVHGIPDEFIEHGTPQELHAMLKLDAPGIASVVKNFFRQSPQQQPAATIA